MNTLNQFLPSYRNNPIAEIFKRDFNELPKHVQNLLTDPPKGHPNTTRRDGAWAPTTEGLFVFAIPLTAKDADSYIADAYFPYTKARDLVRRVQTRMTPRARRTKSPLLTKRMREIEARSVDVTQLEPDVAINAFNVYLNDYSNYDAFVELVRKRLAGNAQAA